MFTIHFISIYVPQDAFTSHTLKPTRISKTNATIIDYINTKNFLEADIKTGDICLSDHFPVFPISKNTRANKYNTKTFIKWRNINSEALLYRMMDGCAALLDGCK